MHPNYSTFVGERLSSMVRSSEVDTNTFEKAPLARYIHDFVTGGQFRSVRRSYQGVLPVVSSERL